MKDDRPHQSVGSDPAYPEQRIRERAYELWEREGRPEGRADQYWRRAEEMIQSEAQVAYPPTLSRCDRN